jgi:hypothetical protein
MVFHYLHGTIASALGVDRQELSRAEPLAGYGVDSLLSMQLLSRISADLGLHPGPESLAGSASIESLAHSLLREIPGGAADEQTKANTAYAGATGLIQLVDSLGEDEVDRLLREVLD